MVVSIAGRSVRPFSQIPDLRPTRIEAHIVGQAGDCFYAQMGRDRTLYVLPKAAFVIRGNAILADCSGETAVWIPCPHNAPERLFGPFPVTIVRLSGEEEDRRCVPMDCTGCRNHECVAYTGPQGHAAPSWHTLLRRGIVASAWTLSK
jgi:hypothetical protein